MFDVSLVLLSAKMAVLHYQEEERFQQWVSQLRPEIRKKILAEREKARQEAIEERRHRELCDAIRSTSFWRF